MKLIPEPTETKTTETMKMTKITKMTTTQGLVGKFFCTNETILTKDEPGLGLWGRILCQPSDGIYLVEFVSWTHRAGEDHDRQQCLLQVKDMMSWTLFDSEQSLNKRVENYIGQVGFEWMQQAEFYFES